jgi:hypothetical protein
VLSGRAARVGRRDLTHAARVVGDILARAGAQVRGNDRPASMRGSER